MFKQHTLTIPLGNTEIHLETGKVARQAGGSIVARCGETVVLSTACAAAAPAEGIDFFPLRVDYQERYSSVGRTASGFIKREGRPAEREILVCRLIDRPLRPMFEEGYYNEVQVLAYVLSYDGSHAPDVLAICAASAALVISEIPLVKPIGAVRVGFIDEQFVVNPSAEQMKQSKLDLVLAGTEDAILMIEGFCDFLTEEQVIMAIETGHKAIQTICHHLARWQKEIGRPKKKDTLRKISSELQQALHSAASEPLRSALQIASKAEREAAIEEIKQAVVKDLIAENTESKSLKVDILSAFKQLQSTLMRQKILDTHKRIDGRGLKDIRPISIEQGLLPRTHGSSLFTRGETQAIAVCTLGGENTAQRFEDLHGEGAARFYLQYFFPPFSVGEVGRMGAPGRREIGHGKLAERALSAILPKKETFPYVIRIESNITESNGSSSMASVCGGCLALMDAGVPIKRPVSGIAMGLILEGDRHAILSDILGVEDALGDMDFKVTGDEHGITAFQMDIKVEGITHDVMSKALYQAKEGRIHILKKMTDVCPEAKAEMSIYAPRIETMQIAKDKIGTVIGPGGKQIRAIVDETGVQIDISDDGIVSIASTDSTAMEKAKQIIFNLTAELEIGQIYTGRIVSTVEFGFFVKIFGKEGLCHISEISTRRLATMKDAPFHDGDSIEVKVLDINQKGQIKLSHRAILEQQEAHR